MPACCWSSGKRANCSSAASTASAHLTVAKCVNLYAREDSEYMLTALDHIIIGANNLEDATRIFSDNLGLIVSGGGIHPSGGTANRIIVIGDTYLELITVRTPTEAQQSLLERLDKGDGY